jgi:fido (protein-threonine AMPylation protein)
VADRYAAQGPEAKFEPGSRGRVLQNLLGIRSVREMARLESEALLAATQQLIDETLPGQRFTPNDICRIHPFRDGNGRCARLLAVLMGLQAGLPALDFSGVRGVEKKRYIAAFHAALDGNYGPITMLFSRIIARTLRSQPRA